MLLAWRRADRLGCRRRPSTVVTAGDGLYGILGVSSAASQEEIKAAYKKLVHSLHPDKNLQRQVDTTAAFVRCKLAYEILGNQQTRHQYDQQHLQSQGPSAHHTDNNHRKRDWQHYNDSQNIDAPNAAAKAASDFAASVAAGAGSSGLAPHTMVASARQTGVHNTQSVTKTSDTPNDSGQGAAGAIREVLLQQHGVALEQFASMQDALDFLQQLEQQTELLGMAAEDYNMQLPQCCDTDTPVQQRWGNFSPGEFAPVTAHSKDV